MTHHYSKPIRKKLRKPAGLARERELSVEYALRLDIGAVYRRLGYMLEMFDLDAFREIETLRQKLPPFVLLAALNLDFLCIHPFRDGNGRVSRLLLPLTCYHSELEVGRYISLERLIEQNKERYYETLEQSSQDWHEGRHDPWPYINYILSILKNAYSEFEDRVDQLKSPRGAKTEQVEAAVKAFSGRFTLYDPN